MAIRGYALEWPDGEVTDLGGIHQMPELQARADADPDLTLVYWTQVHVDVLSGAPGPRLIADLGGGVFELQIHTVKKQALIDAENDNIDERNAYRNQYLTAIGWLDSLDAATPIDPGADLATTIAGVNQLLTAVQRNGQILRKMAHLWRQTLTEDTEPNI